MRQADGNLVWEQGFNRIADLKLLKQKQLSENSLTLTDKWETYSVRFSIYYPLPKNKEMRLNGEGKV